MTAASPTALIRHNQRIAGMLADHECVGELLLVGIAMARAVDLGDPPWHDGTMDIRAIAEQVYGRRQQPGPIVGALRYSDRGDHRPRRRIRDIFHLDRRRYCPDVDGDRGWHSVTCGRPMIRRPGLCDRNASNPVRLVDPVNGTRRWVGACSHRACQDWLSGVVARNRDELAGHPAPQPPANTGGVLERHLPEIDWWQIWRHLDPKWSPPPEGRTWSRPTLTVLVEDEPETPVVPVARPSLAVLEGGWR